MPTYFAGRVTGDTGVINLGSDVTAVRNGVGNYTLTLPAVTSGRFLMTTVTPSAWSRSSLPPWGGVPDARAVFARILSTSRAALSPRTTSVVIGLFDANGTPVDCDFEFVAFERSGS